MTVDNIEKLSVEGWTEAKEWLDIASQNDIEIEKARIEAYRASICSNIYHTVQISRSGQISIFEHSDESMDAGDAQALVLATYPPYDPAHEMPSDDETEELLKRFASIPGAYLILDDPGKSVIKQAIADGVSEGQWVYVDKVSDQFYDKKNRVVKEQVRLAKDTFLYTEALASKEFQVVQQPPITPPSQKPENLSDEDTQDGRVPPGNRIDSAPPVFRFQAQDVGPAPKVLKTIIDQFQEAGKEDAHELQIDVTSISNTKNFLRSWTAVKNAFAQDSVSVEFRLVQDDPSLELNFKGPERLFSRLLPSIHPILETITKDSTVWLTVSVRFSTPRPIHSDADLASLVQALDERYGCSEVEMVAS